MYILKQICKFGNPVVLVFIVCFLVAVVLFALLAVLASAVRAFAVHTVRFPT